MSGSNPNKKDRIYDNGLTYFKIINGNLYIMNSVTEDKDIFAIKICNGFYIELGRKLSEYKSILINMDLPIVFEKKASIYGYVHYNIIRMATNNVDDLILGTLICKDGVICKLICDNSYKDKQDFNTFDSIGILWSGGSFTYESNLVKENKLKAKEKILSLLNLNVFKSNNYINDNFLFSPLGMIQPSELDDIKRKIIEENINSEFNNGNLDYAAELVEDATKNDKIDFEDEVEDDVSLAYIDPENIDEEELNSILNIDTDIDDSETIGDLHISTTYSTIKIEVIVSDTINNREYKFTFILNEIVRMYELISITLV